jgi:adenylyltransferase and sulfurtransferase
MQALETIKVILDISGVNTEQSPHRPTMSIFEAFGTPQWRTFRLRSRKSDCAACGQNPSVTAATIRDRDYETICLRVQLPEIQHRISVQVDLDDFISVRKIDV